MKHAFLALPAVALFATGAFAQTDTTADAATGADAGAATGMEASTSFGTNWPLSVGTTFFADADSSALRSSEEITSGWQSLSQEDRDMIKADCVTFMAEHGDASAGASTDAATDTATDTATTGAATDTTAGAAAGTDAGTASTDGTIATAVGYDITEMKAICEAVAPL